MSATNSNPFAQYKKQSVTTMTPVEIVVALYAEAEKQLNRGGHFIQEKDYESANNALNKTYDVLAALRTALDMKVEISTNLNALYEYMESRVLVANTKKDTAIIDEVLGMVTELKDAFVQISQQPKEPLPIRQAL